MASAAGPSAFSATVDASPTKVQTPAALAVLEPIATPSETETAPAQTEAEAEASLAADRIAARKTELENAEIENARASRAGGQPMGTMGDRTAWSESGLEYRFSLGTLKLPNGQALSYIPLEMGWRFASGWRLRAGFEAFYYQGLDTDASTPRPTVFFYQMDDFRLSALYVWPWRSRLRPLAGLTVESIFGQKQISNSTGTLEPGHGFEAPGLEMGLEYRGGPSWALSLEARYAAAIGYWSNLAGTDLGWHYLF